MKIAIIGTRGIPNNYCVFEQFAEYLSVGLANKNYEVFVYNSHNHIFKDNLYKGVRIIHCYDPEYLIGTAGQFVYDFNCILNSRNRDFDIILQLGYTSSGIWNQLMPSNSALITNMDGLEWKRSKFSKMVQNFLKYSESLVIKHSTHLIADSIGIQQYLKQKYAVDSRYIPYGAELMQEADKSVLDQFGLKEYQYDLLVARIEPENSIETILEGFLKSKKKRDIVVVGSLKTKLGKYIVKKYNHRRIKYLGFVSGLDKLNSLRYFSNLYFHGHSVGGTNPSLLEAMASNSLICAHDNIFNKSILKYDAFYFSNSQHISELIDKEIKNLGNYFVDENRKKIKNLYSWEKIVDSYDSFLKEFATR